MEEKPKVYDLRVRVSVPDPEALERYARERIAASWGWKTAEEALGIEKLTVPTALMEALVLSNENPAPLDYGIEIVEYTTTEVQEGKQPA